MQLPEQMNLLVASSMACFAHASYDGRAPHLVQLPDSKALSSRHAQMFDGENMREGLWLSG